MFAVAGLFVVVVLNTTQPGALSAQTEPTPTIASSPTTVPTATQSPMPTLTVTMTPMLTMTVTPSRRIASTPVPTAVLTNPVVMSASITAIGDSVMLGAVRDLRVSLPNALLDAKKSRTVTAAIQTAQSLSNTGKLGNIVILHIGNNGPMSAAQLDQMMQIVGQDRVAYFVTVKVPRPWQNGNNVVIELAINRYKNLHVIDWVTFTRLHEGAFGGDGIHLGAIGSRLYARMVVDALNLLAALP